MKNNIATIWGKQFSGILPEVMQFSWTTGSMAIFTLMGIAVGCAHTPAEDEVPPMNREIMRDTTHVSGMVLQVGEFYRELISQARIEASTRSDIVFGFDGMITNIYVRIGQRVKQGDLIATLDDFDLQHELEVIRMGLLEKQLSLSAKIVSLGYEVDDTLAIPRDLWSNLKIENGIPALRLKEKMAKYRLELLSIKAPITGVVADVVAQVGNPASNYLKLCTIIGDDNLLIKFPILESELPFVKIGRSVDVFPYHNPDKQYSGVVSAINPQVSGEGMITIIAKLNRSGDLLDGMQVKVHLLQELSNQLIVPKRAIVDRQNRHVAFVYRQGVAHWVYSNILAENTTDYALDGSGPNPGDTIIIENNFDLSHLETVVLDSIE